MKEKYHQIRKTNRLKATTFEIKKIPGFNGDGENRAFH